MRQITIFFLCLTVQFLSAQKKAEYKVASIGFYNLENLFDTIDSPTTNDADFLPKGKLRWNTPKYISKQKNMAKVISELATELTPDGIGVLGVAEVENRKVLEDLVAEPALAARKYQIVHYDSPDERGIDCGLLYQEKYFTVLGSKALTLHLINTKDSTEDHTRDVLLVSGQLPGGEKMHIMVAHWPSRRGGESASAPARYAAAELVRSTIDSLQKDDIDAKIVFMGDLNDDPVNKSCSQIVRGRANPKKMDKTDMYNPMYDEFKNGNGTMAFRDAWSLFDQMMVSKPFVSKKVGGWQFFKAIVWRKDWLITSEGTYKGYPFRTFSNDNFINGYSDHLPVYFFILQNK
jgi:endonuclease/exonuclease/phosphatase family metal-dependent hydrolase